MRIHIRDDLGNLLTIERFPERIVCLVPSLSETLAFLGAQEKLVGITDYCLHPKEILRDIPRVGGTKNPSIRTILSLKPDLVIANADENDKEYIEMLRERARVFVTFPRTVKQAIKTIEDLGTITVTYPRAARFARECRSILSSLEANLREKPLRTVCLVWRRPWIAVGSETYVSDLLETFGFANVFGRGERRYPKTTIDILAEKKPEVILLPDEPYPFGEEEKDEVRALFEQASLRPRILLVDGRALTWFGATTKEALPYLRNLKARLISKED